MSFSIQLHDEILYHLLPLDLYKHTAVPGLPSIYHRRLNYLFIFQTLIGIIGCIYYRRWVPDKPLYPNSIGTLAIYQLCPMMVLHGGFYIFEMLITTLTAEDFNITSHHLVALTIFILHFSEPSIFSVLELTPFLLHELLWYQETSSIYLGILYNMGLFWSGLIGIYVSKVSRAVSLLIPIFAVVESCVNGYAHCYTNGKTSPICFDIDGFSPQGKIVVVLAYTGGVGLVGCAASFYLANRHKERVAQVKEAKKDI